MALYTDSDVVTESMLLAEDPEAAAISAAEGVSIPSAILTAWDTVSAHLAEWLDGQTGGGYNDAVLASYAARSRWDIGCVVASSMYRGQKSAIERAVIWRALESLYRSASARKQNDRMAAKLERAEERAGFWSDVAVRAGVPVVRSPLPCPGAVHEYGLGVFDAESVTSIGGAIQEGTYYVAISWQGYGDQESGPSAVVQKVMQSSGGLRVSRQSVAAPAEAAAPLGVGGVRRARGTATGWNVYVGLSPSSMRRQNGTPLDLSVQYLDIEEIAWAGAEIATGQLPDEVLTVQNSFWRA